MQEKPHLFTLSKTVLLEWRPKESKCSMIGPDSSFLSGIHIMTKLQWWLKLLDIINKSKIPKKTTAVGEDILKMTLLSLHKFTKTKPECRTDRHGAKFLNSTRIPIMNCH